MTGNLVGETRFGPGPWVGEPDRIEWRYRGLPCLMRRSRLGAWCGYVAVPPGHPWHGRGLDLDVSVHGGLTFAEPCMEDFVGSGDAGPICHVPLAGEPDDVWWLGFDCAHFTDIVPHLFQAEKKFRPVLAFADCDFNETYRDVSYVQRACECLGDQVLAPWPISGGATRAKRNRLRRRWNKFRRAAGNRRLKVDKWPVDWSAFRGASVEF